MSNQCTCFVEKCVVVFLLGNLHTFMQTLFVVVVFQVGLSNLGTVIHCNTVYVRLPLKMAHNLQLVQKAVQNLAAGAWQFDSVRPLLRGLYWQPIQFQARTIHAFQPIP